MKNLAIIFVLAWSLSLMACVPSLNPLYTEQDLIYDNSLLGAWVDKDAEETWVFSNAGKLEYKLVQIASDGRSGEFSARLVRIGDELFLDIVPIKTGFAQSDFFQGQFLPTHTFVHIDKKGPRISASVLEPKWLKEVVSDKSQSIRHEKLGGEVLLTASPKDLQAFLVANLKTDEAFSAPTEFTRKGPAR